MVVRVPVGGSSLSSESRSHGTNSGFCASIQSRSIFLASPAAPKVPKLTAGEDVLDSGDVEKGFRHFVACADGGIFLCFDEEEHSSSK